MFFVGFSNPRGRAGGCPSTPNMACLTELPLQVSGVSGFMLVDANVNSGDMMEAFITKTAQSQIPCYYFGLVTEDDCEETIKEIVITKMLPRIKDGSLQLPGVQLPVAKSGSSSGAAGGVVAADDGAQASDAKPNFRR